MFAPFEMIRVVNLPERRDRRREMERELAKAGLENDPRVAFFPAVRPTETGPFASIGARGCFESHLAILREAVAANKAVLILEDDCDFTSALKPGQDFGTDWQIFYGGYHAVDANDVQNSDIIGSHMMGFSAEGAARVFAYFDTLHCPPGVVHPGVDAAYMWFRRAHPDVRVRLAEPLLAVQRSSRSDVHDLRFYDRTPVLREAVNLARQMFRRGTRP